MFSVFERIKKNWGSFMIFLESTEKKTDAVFHFFYGETSLHRSYHTSFSSFLRDQLRNPGLLGILTALIPTLLEIVFTYFIHKMNNQTTRYPILARVVMWYLFLMVLPLIISRAILAACASFLVCVFVIYPQSLYQYFKILKSNKKIMIVSPKSSEEQKQEKKVKVAQGDFKILIPFKQEVVDLNRIYFFNLPNTHDGNSKIVDKIMLLDSDYKNIGFIPMYSSESKIYISRLIWMGIMRPTERAIMNIVNMPLVLSEPIFRDATTRWANESDNLEENDNANKNIQYYFIALSAEVYNIPDVIVPIIAQYIYGHDELVTLSSDFNKFQEYKVHIKTNAHVFFINKAKKAFQSSTKNPAGNVERDPEKFKEIKGILSKFYKDALSKSKPEQPQITVDSKVVALK